MPSIAGTDIKHYKSTTMGASDATSNIGGAISGSLVPDNNPASGVFYSIASKALGDGARVEYAITQLKNTHGTDTAAGPQLCLPASLDDNTDADVFSIRGATADLTSSYFVRCFGLDNLGSSDPFFRDLAANGATLVEDTAGTVCKIGGVIRAMLYDVSGGGLVVAPCDVEIWIGAQLLGVIPQGLWSASGEFSIKVAATLNTSATLTNPLTAPAGTFYKPNSFSASPIALPADLGPADKIQVYWKLTVAERANPHPNIQHPIDWQFS